MHDADVALAEARGRAWAAEIYRRLDEAYGTPDWRPSYAPVDELVLTILSQNTNDINSLRAFEALKARYPTWQAVLTAPVDELAYTIRIGGLGPQKAPRIQAALQRILDERGDFNLDFLAEWPVDRALDWLIGFNGIGPKTASIVLLFCFRQGRLPRRYTHHAHHPAAWSGGRQGRSGENPGISGKRSCPPNGIYLAAPQPYPSRARGLPRAETPLRGLRAQPDLQLPGQNTLA